MKFSESCILFIPLNGSKLNKTKQKVKNFSGYLNQRKKSTLYSRHYSQIA